MLKDTARSGVNMSDNMSPTEQALNTPIHDVGFGSDAQWLNIDIDNTDNSSWEGLTDISEFGVPNSWDQQAELGALGASWEQDRSPSSASAEIPFSTSADTNSIPSSTSGNTSRWNEPKQVYAFQPSSLSSTEPSQQRSEIVQIGGHAADDSIEMRVMSAAKSILEVTQARSLKAAELANALHARLGTEYLAHLREYYGGLLTLLEVAPNVFIVNRVPKEDTVSLANSENLEIDPATVAANLDNINLRRRMLLVGIPPPAAPKSVARSNVDNQTGIDLSETPSACLYLNSVPAIYTESILAAEMTPYNVSTVRLVSHRNRRFGFIGFATTEEAVIARSCLSRTPQWRGLVSYSKKTFEEAQCSIDPPIKRAMYPANTVNTMNTFQSQRQQQKKQQRQRRGHAEETSLMGLDSLNQQHLQYTNIPSFTANRTSGNYSQPHQDQPHPMQIRSSVNYSSSFVTPSVSGGDLAYSGFASSPSVYSTGPDVQGAGGVGYVYQAPGEVQGERSPSMYASTSRFWQSSMDIPPQRFPPKPDQKAYPHPHPKKAAPLKDCPVLKILCDNTYVPTKVWEKNVEYDWKYCTAAFSYLQKSHGDNAVNIIKLKSMLKHKLGASDNIKTAPLKAMLRAYPDCFVVSRNLVSLAGTNNRDVSGLGDGGASEEWGARGARGMTAKEQNMVMGMNTGVSSMSMNTSSMDMGTGTGMGMGMGMGTGTGTGMGMGTGMSTGMGMHSNIGMNSIGPPSGLATGTRQPHRQFQLHQAQQQQQATRRHQQQMLLMSGTNWEPDVHMDDILG